jgi:ribosomal protein L11 methylase PrmA
LIELAAPIAARVRPGGVAIGAGLQLEEAPAVRSAWRGVGLIDESELVDEGWVALAARRQT